ncbi:hypothetical protein [Streptomyces acidicola]|uniref:hypothetical protein n=1 Tax=Streptomyces acidicola TaxID=2596892 RepID=UPI00381CBD57
MTASSPTGRGWQRTRTWSSRSFGPHSKDKDGARLTLDPAAWERFVSYAARG